MYISARVRALLFLGAAGLAASGAWILVRPGSDTNRPLAATPSVETPDELLLPSVAETALHLDLTRSPPDRESAAPHPEEQDARATPAPAPVEPASFTQKYTGKNSGDLMVARDELSKTRIKIAEAIAAKLFESGRFETRALAEGEGVGSVGQEAYSVRIHSEGGQRIAEIARFLPSEQPELVPLDAELSWLNWMIQTGGSTPGPPDSPPAPR